MPSSHSSLRRFEPSWAYACRREACHVPCQHQRLQRSLSLQCRSWTCQLISASSLRASAQSRRSASLCQSTALKAALRTSFPAATLSSQGKTFCMSKSCVLCIIPSISQCVIGRSDGAHHFTSFCSQYMLPAPDDPSHMYTMRTQTEHECAKCGPLHLLRVLHV